MKNKVYLILGHLTRDIMIKEFRYGGAIAYAGLTAVSLGYQVKGITVCQIEEPAQRILEGIELKVKFSQETTTFVNIESPLGRRQQILALADPINLEDIPSSWTKADVVHLAPVVNECPLELVDLFSSCFLVVSAQGYFRSWDSKGLVVPNKNLEPKLFQKFHAMVISIEDLGGDWDLGRSLARVVPYLVITLAKEGSKLFVKGEEISIPAFTSKEIDSCGAGDIYSAVFFSSLYEGLNPFKAALLASCLAGRSVERRGLASIPTPSEIKECYHKCLV